MIRSRFGLKAISLCLALVGLMAIGAGSAQAETGAKWNVNGSAISESLLPFLAAVLVGSHSTLLGSIGGVGIHILCTKAELIETHLLAPNGGVLGRVRFSTCRILRLKEGKAEVLGACEPIAKGTEKGVIETTQGKGLIILSGGKPITLLEPATPTLFATITTSEECAFGEKITINGKLGVKDEKFTEELVTHTITEDAGTTELYINNNKANKATIDGSAEVTLVGISHAGLKWSGKPA